MARRRCRLSARSCRSGCAGSSVGEARFLPPVAAVVAASMHLTVCAVRAWPPLRLLAVGAVALAAGALAVALELGGLPPRRAHTFSWRTSQPLAPPLPSLLALPPALTSLMPHSCLSSAGRSPKSGSFLPSYLMRFMCSLVEAWSSTVLCSASSSPLELPFDVGEIRVNFCCPLNRSSITRSRTRKQLAIVSIAKPSAQTHLCAPTFWPRSCTLRRSASSESTPCMKSKPSALWLWSSVYSWNVSSVICVATTCRCVATDIVGCQPSLSERAASIAM
mmetsp:Transcript_6015/g.13143  ORF Transcript_6015/g.13143 Transcript_6015/m.13143 type:complete len:277 (+) Transcript_6015:998-1828(+)